MLNNIMQFFFKTSDKVVFFTEIIGLNSAKHVRFMRRGTDSSGEGRTGTLMNKPYR